ncbi:MAG: tetratricopeptide repeat protein [Ginsengibacter sp.]
MRLWLLKSALCFLAVLFLSQAVFAQLGKITFDLEKDKPAKFKTKTLKSEKTGEKKFTLPRKLMQNTVSHYNYYFNANNKIKEVIERARLTNNDVYYKLLPFYSYSLKNTAEQTLELDSIIYKATAGILLHDLRSSWVDNFYLLIGKAYLLKQAYDSASMTFQFINYNLYPRKKKLPGQYSNNDDQVVVGTNTGSSGNSISIANKEKSNLLTKTFSLPPSRNDALVWQIRTSIEMEEYSDAAGLINTLRNDVNFPSRLNPYLEEVNAYWFYKQGIYDSAASHLEYALSNSTDMQEKARSEYLLAQLFELSKDRTKASEYYNKAIKHTTDPLLDIYANLSDAKMYDSSGLNEIDKSIAHLLRMAKRDKFETYRNLIYYSAGELALEKPDTAAAEFFIKKSLSYEGSDASFKNKSFLKLADINFIKKDYKAAFAYYDSLQTGDSALVDLAKIQERRKALYKIVNQINIVEREDSLQGIALMTPVDREAFIKSLAKKLKKERGIKDEDNSSLPPSSVFENKNIPSDIFGSNNTRGDWYFYNTSVKAKGYTEFISRWGKRQNIDNWRRVSASKSPGNANIPKQKNLSNDPLRNHGIDSTGDVDAVVTSDDNNLPPIDAKVTSDISYEGLLAAVPTTNEKLNASNTLLSNAVFELGKLLQSDLEDYSSAVKTYEESLRRYPDSLYGGELYMNLSYCYEKLGNSSKSNYYKNLVTTRFAQSKFAGFIKNPKLNSTITKNTEVTKRYEAIYNLFIEGRFDKALGEKKAADSLYGKNYWTPQLLYIESVFYIKQKEDSLAINVLNDIIETYPNSLLKDKAATMIDVLKRRSEIENYLTNLTIERAKEDEIVITPETLPPGKRQIRNDSTLIIKKDSSIQKIGSVAVVNSPVKKDSTPPPLVNTSFNFVPSSPQFVVMLLDKVDPVYISEARNAFLRYNREKFSSANIEIAKEVIDKDRTLLIFRQFTDAAVAAIYSDKIKKDAAVEVSWLPVTKYSFFIISDPNLQLLKLNKDIQSYMKVLHNALPDKF